jgi:hypothetical protein
MVHYVSITEEEYYNHYHYNNITLPNHSLK